MLFQFQRVDVSSARGQLPRGAQIALLAMLSWGLVIAAWNAVPFAFWSLLGV